MPRRRHLVPLVPPPLWDELQQANTVQDQVKTLRKLKNAVIGSDQFKRFWINLGIVPVMNNILQTRRRDTGKAVSKDLNGDAKITVTPSVSDEDVCCIQAANILGNMAQGNMCEKVRSSIY